ncbi:unnamed protein product [Fraxinus pennsylvanica]|uniref:Uncharacterized protein n=1 Tax=Fraxinus pennsylvanica TaxID=56036 RepID=A0AAD1Z2H8_9LAMI|nr:unnamed protein product [Fraxinus pennsylvanica]
MNLERESEGAREGESNTLSLLTSNWIIIMIAAQAVIVTINMCTINRDSVFSYNYCVLTLLHQWHLDKWTNKPTQLGKVKQKFQQIQEAYSDHSMRTMLEYMILKTRKSKVRHTALRSYKVCFGR